MRKQIQPVSLNSSNIGSVMKDTNGEEREGQGKGNILE